jgi:preprotein translocase subunit SecG
MPTGVNPEEKFKLLKIICKIFSNYPKNKCKWIFAYSFLIICLFLKILNSKEK